MVRFVFAVLFTLTLDYALLAVEDARSDPSALVATLEREDERVVLQAIRAIGRFERPELAPSLVPFLSSPVEEIRIEAANALAQMKATSPLAPFLAKERSPRVRAALYEAIGRLDEASEEILLEGLEEEELARLGAMHGLESFYRTKDVGPSAAALAALRAAVRGSRSPAIKKLGLLALNRADDADPSTLDAGLRDDDPGVRRLAVVASKAWLEDPSYVVRYESVRASSDCRRLEAALSDPSEHVVLLAIDRLGESCSPDPLEKILAGRSGWRRPAHALVALAKVSPERARKHLDAFESHEVWQARAYGARAAKILQAASALKRFRRDSHPNVVAEALTSPGDALGALASDDYGLLMTALPMLEKWEKGSTAVPALLDTLARVSAQKRHTSRDPRTLLLERLDEYGDRDARAKLEYLLSDFDPAIAAHAAKVMGGRARPLTKGFAPDPLPPPSFLDRLAGARARLEMKEAGAFVVELYPEVAPLTVAAFAELAESGFYDGLTFHRVVPNFVIQGGSPGANEYVGTAKYVRDEVSTLSHERGTLGISTRGRDTGDMQIFVNLADNYRLDHNYTVFARVVEGMDSVDAILEGDVIESIEIERR
jgi:cyclophilin family peptidyl-prolyl cis-trans isomerase/HEAT repeat protein